MATVATFAAADYAAALAKAQEVLDASGFFDSVTLDSGTVTCTKDGSTIATVKLTQSTFVVTFGSKLSVSEINIAGFIIASTSTAVFVTFLSSSGVATNKSFSVIFTKSKADKLMCGYNQGYARTLLIYAEDTTNTQTAFSSAPIRESAYFSTLVPVCVATGSVDLVSTTADFYLFHDRLSSIPRGVFSSIIIDDKKYLTDGELCVTDDE